MSIAAQKPETNSNGSYAAPLAQVPSATENFTPEQTEKSSDSATTVVEPPRVSSSNGVKRVRTEKDRTNKKIKAANDVKEEPVSQSQSKELASNNGDSEEEDGYKWWEQEQDRSGTQKWETLAHNGVMFPPPYQCLPDSVHLKYENVPVKLPPSAEEVAGFFGAMLETDYAKNETFVKNFFNDFLAVLKDSGSSACKLQTGEPIDLVEFEKCDFSLIFQHYQAQAEARKSQPASVKKQVREEKAQEEEKYRWCYLDGRKQPVGNFRVEPPGLFRGRGSHPKTGKLKKRVYPEDITINIGSGQAVPTPPEGHSWGKIQHDNTVEWLASWIENINNNAKYVRLAASSSLKGMSDFKKFEKARQLKHHIDNIRKDYLKKLTSTSMLERQLATAMYLIDVLALRAGGEKSDDEADTVGCCSLRCEHIKLEQPNLVTFDFLGKDSVRFFQEVKIDRQVFINLEIFVRSPKVPSDDVFDRIDTESLNKHLRGYMEGLTAKVFRTFNASQTMQKQLDKIPVKSEMSVKEKVVAYNSANRTVAILCNHQRNVGKTHDESIERANEKIEEMVWHRIRLKKRILAVDPEQKNVRKAFFSEIKSMKKHKSLEVARRIAQKEKDKLQTKFDRDMEKHNADPKNVPKPLKKDLHEQLAAVRQLEKEYLNEINNREFAATCNLSVKIDKLDDQVKRLDTRISNARLTLQDKQDNSTVALTTSKINYIDPRLTATYAIKHDVPIEKLFTKSLRDKFKWAVESVDTKWRF